jgi:hypothetical protein
MEALLDVFQESIGRTGTVSAFSDHYIRSTVIPNAKAPMGGLVASVGLASRFSLLAMSSLFAVEGAEAAEVARYADFSAAALIASGILTSPSLELIEALYLRALLEFLRQGELEETARVTLALAAQMCLAVSHPCFYGCWLELTELIAGFECVRCNE